ncbi:pyridoxal phosphate-dependent transferase [Paraphoma chrysanthemicola]|uniref:Pyridoxal phosphate-dependent transferase n=1 Tax=Paraphoma chrysanthemicola TaxID=798071 RepID=A0A8K0R6D9_9PLEO|nr:pyridoxal phosphate-dependent transferase [Paraphoma chrysanthemicola]
MGIRWASRRMEGSDTFYGERLAYNDRVERLRKLEYPMLKGKTYLDHGGTTVASKSLLDTFSKEMQSTLLANPHSDASNPSASSIIVAETRAKVLRFFNADPKHFDVVFTANATAGAKLVAECFSGLDTSFDYHYHRNCHTSLVGIRELANSSRCLGSDEDTEAWINHGHETDDAHRPQLFAYSAQSNMNGQRLPLNWPNQLRKSGYHTDTYTILDAAALVSTTPLDLSNNQTAPDFIVLSFYKIFGFPDLGALIVRNASSHILEHRRYFGGGTTEMLTCMEETPWVVRKEASLHARLEDGSIALRSILALQCAIDNHAKLFISMEDISKHTGWLAKTLYDRISSLTHANGEPVCHVYKAPNSIYGISKTQGATIALNFRKSDGSWMGPYAAGAVLRSDNIHTRSGSLCNPAGMACALGIRPSDMRAAFDAGFRCNREYDIIAGGAIFGMLRITFGAMNTLQDVDNIVRCIHERLVDRECDAGQVSKKFEEKSEYSNNSQMKMSAEESLEAARLGTATKNGWIKRFFGVLVPCLP